MNAYLTQPLRKKHGIDWQEEYILGLVDYEGSVRVCGILDKSNEVMTQATTHKYLTQLIDKKLLEHKVVDDRRVKIVTLTKKGINILKEISSIEELT